MIKKSNSLKVTVRVLKSHVFLKLDVGEIVELIVQQDRRPNVLVCINSNDNTKKGYFTYEGLFKFMGVLDIEFYYY